MVSSYRSVSNRLLMAFMQCSSCIRLPYAPRQRLNLICPDGHPTDCGARRSDACASKYSANCHHSRGVRTMAKEGKVVGNIERSQPTTVPSRWVSPFDDIERLFDDFFASSMLRPGRLQRLIRPELHAFEDRKSVV